MRHHRNTVGDERPDQRCALRTPLELDGLGSGLDEPDRVAKRFLLADLVGSEGHVGDQESAAQRAPDRAYGHDHLVERDGKRVLVAQSGVREAVAHEYDIDTGRVDDGRRDRVVRGQGGDLGAGELAGTKARNRHLVNGGCRGAVRTRSRNVGRRTHRGVVRLRGVVSCRAGPRHACEARLQTDVNSISWLSLFTSTTLLTGTTRGSRPTRSF